MRRILKIGDRVRVVGPKRWFERVIGKRGRVEEYLPDGFYGVRCCGELWMGKACDFKKVRP